METQEPVAVIPRDSAVRRVFLAALDEEIATLKRANSVDDFRETLEQLQSLIDLAHGSADNLVK